MAYTMMNPFIIPTMVYQYASAVEDSCQGCATTGLKLLSHCSKVSLCVVAQFQRDSYNNCNDNEDIVSYEWTKELFVNSSGPALIKRVGEEYEALYRLEKVGITYLNIALDEMINVSDVLITLLQ